MKLRRWFRVLLLVLLAGLAWLVWSVWRWRDPEKLRCWVLEMLARRFPEAEVSLGRVYVTGLASVVLEEIEVRRRDANSSSALQIGRGVVYLDRLELARGRVVPTELVLQQSYLHLRRKADGQWDYPPLLLHDDTSTLALAKLRLQQGVLEITDEVSDERCRCDFEQGEFARRADNWDFQLRGALSWGGRITLSGSWRPAATYAAEPAASLTVSWQLEEVPITPQWQARLVRLMGRNEIETWQAHGWLGLRGELHYRPGQAWQWLGLDLTLRQVTVAHPKLPEPIYALQGNLRWDGQQLSLQALQGEWLGAKLQVRGRWTGLHPEADGEIEASLQPLPLAPPLYDKLPPALRKICQAFSPEGPVHLHLHYRRQHGQTRLRIRALLQELSLCFDDFPYPVRKAVGELEYTDSSEDMPRLSVDITGQASGRRVQLRGEAFGSGLRPENPWRCGLRLNLDTEDIPLDETLLKALPPRTQLLARDFRPHGLVRVHAEIRRPPGTADQPFPTTRTHIQAQMQQGQVCYKRLPYPLEQVQGLLEIDLPAETWRASGFAARHKEGLLFVTAQGEPTPRGEKVTMTLQGQQVALDEELRDALPEKMQRVWDELQPRGRADFLAQLDWVGEQPPELDLTVTARGQCAIRPRCFPYTLEQLQGSARYRQDQVTIGRITARHGDSRIFLGRDQLGGVLRLSDTGGWLLELYEVRGDLLYLDRELLAALPEGLRTVLASLQPDRPLRLVFDLQVENPRGDQVQSVRWNGHVSFARCTWQCGIALREATGYVSLQGTWQPQHLQAQGQVQLQQVQVWRLPLRELASQLQIRDGAVYFPGVRAKLLDGQIFGPIRYDYQPQREFRLDLTLAQVNLQTLAQQLLDRPAKTRGKIQARLILTGQPGDWRTLRGKGVLSITDAHIYDLPPFFNLLNLLSGQLPRNAAFQEVQTRFVIEGPRVQFSRVELLGEALTLRGQGSMRVDGSELDLEMYALLWGRSLPLLPPGIDRIPPLISRQLVKIHMRGSLEQVVVTREPVPLVTDTLRLLWQLGPGRLEDANEP